MSKRLEQEYFSFLGSKYSQELSVDAAIREINTEVERRPQSHFLGIEKPFSEEDVALLNITARDENMSFSSFACLLKRKRLLEVCFKPPFLSLISFAVLAGISGN